MFNWLFGYKSHSEAIIVACYFNPENNPYRLRAFNLFYKKIKHMNHKIIECVIGDGKPQLPNNENIEVIYTESKLWHKEGLLNKAIRELPSKYKYVFWLDTDVIFKNRNWMVESVQRMKDGANIVQPFEYCIHLERNQLTPGFNVNTAKKYVHDKVNRYPRLWRSFCATFYDLPALAKDRDYNLHGHVGFAWGAKREILDKVPLFDKGLIGGADHIIAHAAAGHIPHGCIHKAFKDNIEEIEEWSRRFAEVVGWRIDYASGMLYHIWHGELGKREYLKRVQEFTKENKTIHRKDSNGLYIHKSKYVNDYFKHKECDSSSDDFLTSLIFGYITNSTIFGWIAGGSLFGGFIGDMLNDYEDNNHQEDCFS